MSSPDPSEPPPPPQTRNAFSELMSPKPKSPNSTTTLTKTANAHHTNTALDRRDGLLAYIQNPASFPASRVIRHNANFVTIHDLYPKASIHLLLLPRDPSIYHLDPFTALSNPTFLASVRAEAAILKALATNQLRRLFGHFSESDKPYLAAMESSLSTTPTTDSPLTDPLVPPGRDWSASLQIGIHAHPSMHHLHLHLISVDLGHSPACRHRKHYNSFATPFFVPLDDFPLDEHDVRRHPGREGYLRRDLLCWRCGRAFGNRFARLKEHLEDEFEAWKRE